MSPNATPRRKKLIRTGLQLRLTAKFVGIAILGMVLQFLFLGYRLMDAMETVEGRGGDLATHLPALMLETLGISLLVILPLMVLVGILLTFRVAGPIYRFEQYLASVAEGEETRPCSIREGDELQSLCDAINRVTGPLVAKDTEGPLDQAA